MVQSTPEGDAALRAELERLQREHRELWLRLERLEAAMLSEPGTDARVGRSNLRRSLSWPLGEDDPLNVRGRARITGNLESPIVGELEAEQ